MTATGSTAGVPLPLRGLGERLGVGVFVFGRGGSVGPLFDPDVLEYCTRVFADEFYLNPDASVTGVHAGDEVQLSL